MANQYINKVVNGETGDVLIDLSGDSLLNASQLASGVTAHTRSGAPVTGTNTNDMDTSTFNATASQILSGATAGVQGSKVTGTMTNNGNNNVTVTSKSGTSIAAGYYDGSGKAVIDSTSATNLVAGNIRAGITILGIEGEMTGEDTLTVGAASATPTSSQQVITAASLSYDYITQVTVAAIPYTETDNQQGGKTVVIAGSAA